MTVNIKIGRDRYRDQGEMIDWCEEHFGERGIFSESVGLRRGGRWQCSWAFGTLWLEFVDEGDAAFFSLRWR